MKTLFMAGFSRPSFVPMLGQDIITSYDQGQSTDQIPNLYTSVEQGPPAQPLPGAVTTLTPSATPSSGKPPDWGKILSDMIKAGSATYQGLTKDQIAQAAARQRAGLPTGLPNVPASSGVSSTALVVGGVAAAALIAVIATR